MTTYYEDHKDGVNRLVEMKLVPDELVARPDWIY